MQTCHLWGLNPIDGGGVSGGGASACFNFRSGSLLFDPRICLGRTNKQHRSVSSPTTAINCKQQQQQDHYAVLGLSTSASSSDIKAAYRFLARKYHPDVNKDSQAGEKFKTIRLAYDVLSNEETRAQYDYALKFHIDSGRTRIRNWEYDPEFEDGLRIYSWAEFQRQIRREKYWRQYEAAEQNPSAFEESENIYEEASEDERGSFGDVLKFTFFLLFFVQTLGVRVSLVLCSLTALLDEKLDAGYKVGYLIAWILGGRGGILLSVCLSFASWLCGKTSSSLVALVVVAIWFTTNLARYVPLPQGALITLLYMSVKLQEELR